MCGIIEAIVGREGADERRDRSAGVRREVLGAAQNYLDNNQTYQLGRTGGQAAQNLGGLIGADGRDPTETLMETPGYQFRYDQGRRARNQLRSLAGSLYSGAAMKEAERYGQNYASNEFQNAFNRNYALVSGANQAGAQALGVQANAWNNFGQMQDQALQDKTGATLGGVSAFSNALGFGAGNFGGGGGSTSQQGYTVNGGFPNAVSAPAAPNSGGGMSYGDFMGGGGGFKPFTPGTMGGHSGNGYQPSGGLGSGGNVASNLWLNKAKR